MIQTISKIGHKEQLVEQEQTLLVMKQRIRETHDELEDLRSLTQNLSSQLEDYRNKYLQVGILTIYIALRTIYLFLCV